MKQATLSWYESKKSLEASNEVSLGGAVVDSFGKVIFVQQGDAVFDFEAKSKSEFESWFAGLQHSSFKSTIIQIFKLTFVFVCERNSIALESAQRWASSVDQKLPLARYKAREIFPVRVLLPLPNGMVRIVCNTKHTGKEKK